MCVALRSGGISGKQSISIKDKILASFISNLSSSSSLQYAEMDRGKGGGTRIVFLQKYFGKRGREGHTQRKMGGRQTFRGTGERDTNRGTGRWAKLKGTGKWDTLIGTG